MQICCLSHDLGRIGDPWSPWESEKADPKAVCLSPTPTSPFPKLNKAWGLLWIWVW